MEKLPFVVNGTRSLHYIYIYTLMTAISLCWCRWYISHIHHFAGSVRKIYTTLRNVQFSPLFLDEMPAESPDYEASVGKCPNRS